MAPRAPVNPEQPAVSSQLPAAEAAEAVHGHETAASTASVEAHGGEGGGLPQFQFEYWGGQIVWLLVLFAILYVLLSRVFVPRLRRALDDRAETISGAVAAARATQAEADAQADAARAELAEARARAGRTASDAKAASGAETARRQAEEEAVLHDRLAAAEARIAETRDAAMKSVRDIAADTTAAVVDRLTGRAASPAEIGAAFTVVRGTA